MLWLLRQVGGFLLRRLGTFLFLSFFLVMGMALYLAGQHYFRDAERRADEIRELILLREDRLASLTGEMERVAADVEGSLVSLEQSAERYRQEVETRRRQLEELSGRVDRLRGWWLWMRAWISSEAAQELADVESRREALASEARQAEERLLETQAQAEETRERLGERSGELRAEEKGLSAELGQYRAEEKELRRIAEQRRRVLGTTLFWLREGLQKAGPLLAVLALSLFLLPPLLKVGLYYGWAPLLQRARPVRLASPGRQLPRVVVGESRPALELEIAPEERVILHHNYYQASDEDLQKKTKFLLDWRFPLTSLACRLAILTEVTNTGRTPAHITVSNQEDATCELSLLHVPTGSSVVLRPTHLVALRHHSADRPLIRSHWCFSLHAWITLQFRYFELVGPCTLVVKGRRGVRGETVQEDPTSPGRTRRTNQLATIGFTPTLAYHSRRAETFWSYFTGKNPLFDDVFTGCGSFVCQQISKDDTRLPPGSFWRGIGDVFLKAFGL